MLLIVNYHYFGSEQKYERGIYPTSPERFKKQLELLGENFKFISQGNILGAIEKNKELPEKSCLITLDDGLISQYEEALPILDELNIPAIFFVNGVPYDKYEPLLVSKIHWCRAHIKPKEFLEKVKENYLKITREEFKTEAFDVSDEELKKHYYYDIPDEARLKFALDKSSLNQEVKKNIIDNIFSGLVGDEKEFCKSFYMTHEQIKDLHKRDYLGSHTYSHKALGLISVEECKNEISNLNAIKNILGDENVNIQSISYPYGNSEVVPANIANLAKSAGFKLGFTMERSLNRGLSNPFHFARFDTNDVPGGKSPYFEIRGGNIRIINNEMSLFRKDFFREYARDK